MLRLALALWSLTALPLAAQTDPAEAARAAARQIEAAALSLQEAESARDRVRALTETVKAYEAGLAEGRGVTTYKGRLIETLHVADARRKLVFAELIAGRIGG
jgi:hypothetical protein